MLIASRSAVSNGGTAIPPFPFAWLTSLGTSVTIACKSVSFSRSPWSISYRLSSTPSLQVAIDSRVQGTRLNPRDYAPACIAGCGRRERLRPRGL